MKTLPLLTLIAFFVIPFSKDTSAADGKTSSPNVLMIVVDDMNDWVGCLGGHPDVQTPNIDGLAARGMLLANAHTSAPVCNPSRVATMTGRMPGTTGVYDNSVRWHEALTDIPTIPQHFKANGYEVFGGGKIYHHMPGFNRNSDWDQFFDQKFDGHYQDRLSRGIDVTDFRYPKGFPLNGLPSVKDLKKPPRNPREFDWGPLSKSDRQTGDGQMVDWATKILKQQHTDPFFLAVGIYRPHLPFYAPQKYFEIYPQDSITLPQVKDDDLDDLPSAGQAMASQRREDYRLVMDTGKYRELLQAYLASITFADALIGQVLQALDQSGKADDTIIVLWSDHGWHLGEKKHLHKFTLWERSTHIPMVMVVPGVTSPGSVCRKPVSTIDVFPTLIDLCQLPSVQTLSGQSVTPLLRNPKQTWNRPAMTTHGQGNHALRSERWRYIRYADGSEELYDHSVDPHEWTNLAGKKEFAQIKKKLARWVPTNDAKRLKKKRKKTVDDGA